MLFRYRLAVTLALAAGLHALALGFLPDGMQAADASKPVTLSLLAPPPVPDPAPKVVRHNVPAAAKAATATTVLAAETSVAVEEGETVSAGVAAGSGAVLGLVSAPASPSVVSGDADAFTSYRQQLAARVAAMQRYPVQARRMHTEGVTTARFRLARDGHLLGAPTVATSSHALLDAEALRMIAAAAPFPSLPQGLADEVEFTLPIRFSLTN
jgi:TonB family protein